MVTPGSRRSDRPNANPRDKVLLTGFDAFGSHTHNPSGLIAQALHGRQVAGHQVVAAQLPTVFGASLAQLEALMNTHRPTLVICLGLAARHATLRLERIAVNWVEAHIPDNAGQMPVGQPVIAQAPHAYFTRLPLDAMQQALQTAHVPVEQSPSAGSFVCNHLFFGLLHRLATTAGLQQVRGGFIHVPQLPEQGTPHMALNRMVQGLRLAIRAALTTPH